jgi:sulfate transport system permease protein
MLAELQTPGAPPEAIIPTHAPVDVAQRPGIAGYAVIAFAVLGVLGLIGLPLFSVFFEALRAGAGAFFAVFGDPYAQSAIRLTIIVALSTVAFNAFFGILAGWTISKYDFPGKALLLAVIDLPLTVSPVVAGLAVLLTFGAHSPLGSRLLEIGIRIAFAPAGIVLATIFVTFPYIARELIAFMQEQGRDQEEAALVLGASVWQTLWRVTIPGARVALFNGIILCGARAIGEFGAVSVISGRVRGYTETVPLHIEALYNESSFTGAFALAAALAFTTIAFTLIVSTNRKSNHDRVATE